MTKLEKILLGVCVMAILLFAFVPVRYLRAGNPQLNVTYLTQTNDVGQCIAFFAITNVGNAAAISSPLGVIEIDGQSKTTVGCQIPIHRLAPSESDVVKVYLPPGIVGRWRYTTLYAHEKFKIANF